jgi:Ca2+-binding EF-hand superfamily protein
MKPDENGRIDFNEFLKFNKGDLNDGEDEVNQAKNFFNHLDTDRNGLISFDEFKHFAEIHPDFASLNEQQIKDVFAKNDSDKDGRIDINGLEFKYFIWLIYFEILEILFF